MVLEIDTQKLEEVLAHIVSEEFPDEVSAFAAGGKELLEQLNSNGRAPRPSHAPYEFGIPISDTLNFISLAIGTYFAIKKFIGDFRPHSASTVRELSASNIALVILASRARFAQDYGHQNSNQLHQGNSFNRKMTIILTVEPALRYLMQNINDVLKHNTKEAFRASIWIFGV